MLSFFEIKLVEKFLEPRSDRRLLIINTAWEANQRLDVNILYERNKYR